jgi:hypothetical protein
MGNGFHLNGHPPEPPAVRIPVRTLPPPRRRLRLPLLLFLLTVISTLFVGLHLRQAYERNQPPFSDAIYSVEIFQQLGKDPWLLLQGWPFAAAGPRTGPLLRLPLLRHHRQLSLLHSRAHADRDHGRLHPHRIAHRQPARFV